MTGWASGIATVYVYLFVDFSSGHTPFSMSIASQRAPKTDIFLSQVANYSRSESSFGRPKLRLPSAFQQLDDSASVSTRSRELGEPPASDQSKWTAGL